ncbi:hypothetical protein [Dongia sedimenti]|uniref:Uncharacterized protein n=1 Tax=Dongia sedimenti TaxID=3064282 RepID=A0ABU0YMG9_9PROT|nr:hypothetical protein [Rhodospirillaceae bacterium R-7]
MPKKSTDPFMDALWSALIADELGPAGNRTGWAETPVRIRNRFIRAVRPVLQSGAAFQVSAMALRLTESAAGKTAPPPGAGTGRRAKSKRPDPRELQLPLMTAMQPREKRGR